MRRSQSGKRRRKPSPRKYPNYAKYVPDRKSPARSATIFPVGFMMTGGDGELWRIHKGKSGIKRWVRVNLSNTRRSKRSGKRSSKRSSKRR